MLWDFDVTRNPKHRAKPALSQWMRRYGFVWRLIGCFSLIFASAVVVALGNCGRFIWFANGIGLSYLLLAPRWRWKYYLGAFIAGIFVARILVYPYSVSVGLVHAFFNSGEVLLGAFALRKRSAVLPRFTQQRYLFRFTSRAVLAAPIVTAILYAAARWPLTGTYPWSFVLNWFSTDALGITVTTPACVSIFQSHLPLSSQHDRHWILLIVLIPVTIAAFCQSHLPVLFMIYPLVGLILFRYGLGWAAVSTLFVAAVGGACTIRGLGPFAIASPAISRSPTVLLQLYIASGMFLVFSAGSVMEALRETERRLRETVYLHDLVTESSRDVIILADFKGRRSYVSAAASTLGGWNRDELLGMSSLDLVHPDDHLKALSIVHHIRKGSDGGLLECRVKNKSGQYVWVESNLRPVRDPNTGAPIGILNMVRDISRRKLAEDDLKQANAALEALAITDPLTHLSNRRHFDRRLADEWRRCTRQGMPLSLLILDADWFKSYNDTYGHPQGDLCLKQIAESALEVVTRPGDLVARIGGEEFAIILPNTTSEGAMQVAGFVCESLRRRQLPHNANPVGHVTISVGCATTHPAKGQQASALIQRADKALYAAKHAGRNQVCSANDLPLDQHTRLAV